LNETAARWEGRERPPETAPGLFCPKDECFVPPYPVRPTARLPLAETLRRLRRNLLEVWYDRHFELDAFPTRLLNRRVVVCNSPTSIAEAFVGEATAIERKTPQMRRALAPLVGEGLIISDGPLWRERRRLAAPVTHASLLPVLLPIVTEAALAQRAAWAAAPVGTIIDLLAAMGALAARIIGRVVFGRALDDTAARCVVAAFAAYQRGVGAGDVLALLGAPAWLPRLAAPGQHAARCRIHAVLDALIDDALARPGDGLIGALTAAGVTDRRALRDEAATLFLAGHETTATTLAWCFYLLDQVPAAAARIRAEAAMLGARAPGFDDLAALPVTRAVVEETLRLYPPIPLLAREASRTTTIAGFPVRRGDLVMAVPWLLHRHRKLWDAPDAFRPERFLPDAPRPPRHAFLPFSLGPRVCTGAAFAMAEMVIVLATLLPHFAPTLAPGAVVFPVCRLTLRPGETLPMRLQRV